jgi:hypothetical protein
MSYRCNGSGLVFRTDPGITLRAMVDRAAVVEIDAIEPSSTPAGVVVRGRGRETDGSTSR